MNPFDVLIEGRLIVLEIEIDARTRTIELTLDEADELVSALTEAIIELDLDACDDRPEDHDDWVGDSRDDDDEDAA
jgi:hypothetical protein